jgi:tripartite-type tricarboxylate transporter receptor subunit TctC
LLGDRDVCCFIIFKKEMKMTVMRMNRVSKFFFERLKKSLLFITLSVVATMTPMAAGAQSLDGPVTIVVPSDPGSAPDVLARILTAPLSERLGQPVVVENRPGAGGNIGALAVAKAKPDGRTLFLTTVNMTIAPWMKKTAPFNPVADFTAIGQVASVPMIVIVHPELGAKTMTELVALAKSKPSQVNYSSPGIGSLNHLAAILFERAAGIKMTHVPYKSGSASTTAVLGQEVQLFFAGMPPAVPHVKSGALLGLAVTASTRSALTPDVPTLAEAGYPGLESDAWYALLAPKDLPAALVSRFNDILRETLDLPTVKSQFMNSGAEVRPSSASSMAKLLSDDSQRYQKLLDELGLVK